MTVQRDGSITPKTRNHSLFSIKHRVQIILVNIKHCAGCCQNNTLPSMNVTVKSIMSTHRLEMVAILSTVTNCANTTEKQSERDMGILRGTLPNPKYAEYMAISARTSAPILAFVLTARPAALNQGGDNPRRTGATKYTITNAIIKMHFSIVIGFNFLKQSDI